MNNANTKPSILIGVLCSYLIVSIITIIATIVSLVVPDRKHFNDLEYLISAALEIHHWLHALFFGIVYIKGEKIAYSNPSTFTDVMLFLVLPSLLLIIVVCLIDKQIKRPRTLLGFLIILWTANIVPNAAVYFNKM